MNRKTEKNKDEANREREREMSNGERETEREGAIDTFYKGNTEQLKRINEL